MGVQRPGENFCPEPAMVEVINASSGTTHVLAMVRGPGTTGLRTSVSKDGGFTWDPWSESGIDAASSKPSLASADGGEGNSRNSSSGSGSDSGVGGDGGSGGDGGGMDAPVLLLSYNIHTRVRMALDISRTGGSTWEPFALLDK